VAARVAAAAAGSSDDGVTGRVLGSGQMVLTAG